MARRFFTRVGIFSLVFFVGTLFLSETYGQSPLNRWNDLSGFDPDANGNTVIELESFDAEGIPSNWTQEYLSNSSSNSPISWQTRVGGGYRPNKEGHPSYTSNLKGRNALFFAMDKQAKTYLITPLTTLKRDRVQAPALRFKYAASSKGSNYDKLSVFYRFGPHDGWKLLAEYDERQEAWVDKIIPLKEKFKSATDADLNQVQFGFLGECREGWGVCIDELMVVELEGRPIDFGSAEIRYFSDPVGQGTALNELLRIQVDLTAGSGFMRLANLGLEYSGDAASDIEKLSLYHTTSPYFSAAPENRLCNLTFSGGKVTGFTDKNPSRSLDLGSGTHYLWVLADIKSTARLKNKVSFSVPQESVKLAYYDSDGVHGGDKDKLFPTESSSGASSRVYAVLLREGFEGGSGETLSGWTFSIHSPWNVGKPHPEYLVDPQEYKSRPLKAAEGEQVLATGKSRTEAGVTTLWGGYPSGRSETNGYVVSKSFDAEFHRDVKLKLKYFLNLASGDRALIQVRGGATGFWSTVREFRGAYSMTGGWQPLVLDISDFASRRKDVEVRFLILSDADKQESGFYVDDFQILADAIQRDVGIERVERPAGMVFTNASKIRVELKNYGAETVNGPIPVRVTGSGRDVTAKFTGSLAKGASEVLEIGGLELAPRKDVNNEMLFVVEIDQADDDPTNNSASIRFYSYPIFEVSEATPYPESLLRRMDHWFPESWHAGDRYSWTQLTLNQLSKNEIPFKTTPLYSHYVWTTGRSESYKGELSTLTGPVFELRGPEQKQVVVGYAMAKRVKLRFEYTQNGKDWTTLTSDGSAWSNDWYGGPEHAWSLSADMEVYGLAKIELPVATGMIQLRAVFENPYGDGEAGRSAGVAINGVEVRCIRPDYRITGHTPESSCAGLMGDQPLHLKVKNVGPVPSKAFECPVELTVYSLEKTSDLSDPSTMTYVGTHMVTLSMPEMSVGDEQSLNTTVKLPWDYSRWGYYIEAQLRPELSEKKLPDEDVAGNEYAFDVRAKLSPYLPVNVDPITKTLYVESLPHTETLGALPEGVQEHYARWGGYAVGTSGSANMSISESKATFTSAGSAQLIYSSFAPDGTELCSGLVLDFNVATTNNKIRVTNVLYPDQGEESETWGCHIAGGEDLKVTIKNEGLTDYVGDLDLYVYVNGQKVGTHTYSSGLIAGAEATVIINAQIPSGESELLVFAQPTGGNWNFSGSSQRIPFYRWAAPELVDIFVRARTNPDDMSKLPYEHPVVPYYGTQTLELYVPPRDAIQYRWYKLDTPSATPGAGTEGGVVVLGDASAYYLFGMSYSNCPEKRYTKQLVEVRTDDIEVVAFTGVDLTGGGICGSTDEGVPLKVDIRNHSRTTYPAGTELKFRISSSSTAGTLSEEVTVSLENALGQMESYSVPLPPLKVSSLMRVGDNRLTVEFLTIAGKEDGDKTNNFHEQDIRLKQTPWVLINGEKVAQVKRTFLSTDSYVIETTSSADASHYEWFSKQEGGMYSKLEGSTASSYTVEGIPQDIYRVEVTNLEQCSNFATVTFIQTDIAVGGILAPRSACKLEENDDLVEVEIKNTGSKVLEPGTELALKLILKLGGTEALSVDETYTLVSRLVPDASIEYTFMTPGIRPLITGKRSAVVEVHVQMNEPEDVDLSNQVAVLNLRGFGYPKLGLTSLLAYKATGGVNDTVRNGASYKIYSASGDEEFKVDVPSGAGAYWGYQEDPYSSVMQPFNPGVGEIKLPTDETRSFSSDGRGSGYYFVTVRNPYGCESKTYFHLKVEEFDLGIAALELPQDACSFSGHEKVNVEIKNFGTEDLPMGEEINFTVTTKIGAAEVEKKDYTTSLPALLPPDKTQIFPFPINLSGHDGSTFTIEVTAAFADVEKRDNDRRPDNNFKSGDVRDKKNAALDGVLIETVPPSARDGEYARGNPVYTFEPTYEEGGEKKQTVVKLTDDSPSASRQWYTGPGLTTTVQDPPLSYFQEKSVEVVGAGRVCLEVKNDEGCPAKFCVNLRPKWADLIIDEIKSPESQCLGEGLTDLTVTVSVKNVGKEGWEYQPLPPDGGVDFKLEVFGPDDFTKKLDDVSTELTREPFSKFPGYYKTGSNVPDPAGVFASDATHEVTLSHPIPKISEKGKYRIRVELIIANGLESNPSNNTTEVDIEFYPNPTLDATADLLGGENEEFYASEALLGAQDHVEDLCENFQWFAPNGEKVETRPLVNPTASQVIVTQPGVYTMKCQDAHGCWGQVSKTVLFPAYLQFVENSASQPVSACDFDGEQPLEFQIVNMGKVPYAPRTDVPFTVKYLAKPADASDFSEDLAFDLQEEIPAGGQATVVIPKLLDLSQDGHYEIQVAIGSGADGSQTVLPAEKRPERLPLEFSVDNHRKPGLPSPSLYEQAVLNLNALGHSDVNLKRIPKGVTFALDAVEGTGDPMDALEKTTYNWIHLGETEGAITFNRPGNYVVEITNEHGCVSVTEDLDLRYLLEYAISAVLEGFDPVGCVDPSVNKKELPVVVKVSITTADAPIPAETQFFVSYTLNGTEKSKTIEWEKELQEGDSILFGAEKLGVETLGAGDHTIHATVYFLDEFSDKCESTTETKNFSFHPNPQFAFPKDTIWTSENYTLTVPPITPEGTYTYAWNNEPGGAEYVVKNSGVVQLTVTSAQGCFSSAQVEVLFQKKLTIAQSGEGTVLVQLLDALGQVEADLKSGDLVEVGRSLKITVTPAGTHELEYVLINGAIQSANRGGFTRTYTVEKDVQLDVGFKPKKETSSVSPLLSDVLCVTPFNETLTLFHTENVVRYEVLNQLGQSLITATCVRGERRIDIQTASLTDGLYLVKLTAVDGTTSVVRAIKSR